jgi:hypothetical protein
MVVDGLEHRGHGGDRLLVGVLEQAGRQCRPGGRAGVLS